MRRRIDDGGDDDELALSMLNRTIPIPNPYVPSHVACHRPIPSRPHHVPSSHNYAYTRQHSQCRAFCSNVYCLGMDEDALQGS